MPRPCRRTPDGGIRTTATPGWRLAAASLCARLLSARGNAMTFMPRDIAEKIRTIGPVIDPPATAAVYAPLQEKEPYSGVKVTRDIKDGADARQALDLFVPESAGSGRPGFIYVDGGG